MKFDKAYKKLSSSIIKEESEDFFEEYDTIGMSVESEFHDFIQSITDQIALEVDPKDHQRALINVRRLMMDMLRDWRRLDITVNNYTSKDTGETFSGLMDKL
jgi:hypothetical protein